MNKKRFVTFCISIAVISSLLAILLLPACATQQPSVLKGVSFLPKDNPNMTYVNVFVDRVNEQGQGILTIDYVGGPEVVPGFDQMAALQSGAMDIIFNPTAYYAPVIPAADTLHLTELT